MAKKSTKNKKVKFFCPLCDDGSVLRKNNPRYEDYEHDRYKCPECGERFFKVGPKLESEKEYSGDYETDFLHPNESYEDFMDHESFD